MAELPRTPWTPFPSKHARRNVVDESSPNWRPLLEALALGEERLGSGAWEHMKRWWAGGELPVTGSQNGSRIDIPPSWVAFLIRFVSEDSLSGRAADIPLGTDAASDQPTESRLYFERPNMRGQIDGISDVRVDLYVLQGRITRQLECQEPTLDQWYQDWVKRNPRSSEKEVWAAAKIPFPGTSRQTIRKLRRPPDGSPMKRGRKSSKPESEFR
jgi:hypothetical protein